MTALRRSTSDTMFHRNRMERVIEKMYDALYEYADSHRRIYGVSIAHDPYTGAEWLKMWDACRALLTCETGQLNCGAMDTKLLDLRRKHNFPEVD